MKQLSSANPAVFLHIPKTAGQTVHNELARVAGEEAVSPIRVHTQATGGAPQMPVGYALYSGHIDWTELETLPEERFVFTVLRDPGERIASFYFYLRKEARILSEADLEKPHNLGKRNILKMTADDYFFGGEKPWQRFIHDHYDNFYCSYFATRKMRGWGELQSLDEETRVARACAGLADVDQVYDIANLGALERDVAERYGAQITLEGNYHNAGLGNRSEPRWPCLLDLFESDAEARKLEQFVQYDELLIDRITSPRD